MLTATSQTGDGSDTPGPAPMRPPAHVLEVGRDLLAVRQRERVGADAARLTVAGVRSAGRLRLPVSTSRVHCPSVGTVAVRPRPSPGPQQMSAEPDTAAGSAARPDAGRTLLSTTDTAAAPSAGTGTPRPPVADHPCTPAGCGGGHRPPPADTTRVSRLRAERRPPGDTVRTAGRWPRRGCPVDRGTGRGKRPRSTAASGTAAGVRTAGVRPDTAAVCGVRC
jgi:hypothetical protein